MAPGQVIEVRALNVEEGRGWEATYSGYFDDAEALVSAVQKLPPAGGVYFTPNPVNPALLARACNRLKKQGKGAATTSDKDIVRRRFLPIDADPVRPAKISATDEEHELAIARTKAIAAWLTSEFDWPESVRGDSGNGGHLVYKIDLPVEDDGLVERAIEAVAHLFDDDAVTIDQTVFNPARIWKLYGTPARKGDSIPERPHRLARILEAPDEQRVVSREMLEELAGLLPQDTAHAQDSRPSTGARFDIERWIADQNLDADRKDWRGGSCWVLAVCPFNSDHDDRSAVIVQDPSGKLGFTCHHNGCTGKDWRALREKLEPGWRELRHASQSSTNQEPPEAPPPYDDEPVGLTNGRTGEPYQPTEPAEPRFKLVPASELSTRQPVQMLIDELPAQRLSVMVGPPESGKSFIASDWAFKVGQEHPVIYVAAEDADGYAPRMLAWCNHHRRGPGQVYFIEGPVNLFDAREVAAFIDIAQEIGPALVVFDTLNRCSQGADENSARDMAIVINNADAIRKALRAALLLAHHPNKNGSYRGSSVILGNVDSMIAVENEDGTITIKGTKGKNWKKAPARHLRLITLETGRTVPDTGEPETSCVLLPAGEVIDIGDTLSDLQHAILEVLNLSIFSEAGAKATQIADMVKKPTSTLYWTLEKLKKHSYIEQAKKGDPFYITELGRVMLESWNRRLNSNGNSNDSTRKASNGFQQQVTPNSNGFQPDSNADSNSRGTSNSNFPTLSPPLEGGELEKLGMYPQNDNEEEDEPIGYPRDENGGASAAEWNMD
jgi:DNA-binding PadR family transcriptional regulator